jgi:hypothetical protein
MRALSILWVMLGHAIAELNVVGFSNPADAFPPMGMTHTLVREGQKGVFLGCGRPQRLWPAAAAAGRDVRSCLL